LEPGESAEYEITTNGVPSKSFTPQRGAQVVVSDASLDYRFRAVTNVPSPNDASEIFWPNNGPVPFGELADGRNRMYQVLENPSAYYVNLGDGYRAHGDVNAAEQAYAEALAHNPENQQALTGLAQLRQMSREDDD
jgi:tetratricopeptide (TPR) repeat protein